MENDILDALEDLGYSGTLPLDESSFQQALEGTSVTAEYTELVEWLTKDLKNLCDLEEQVNAISNVDDAGNFLLELSSFLREYGCPYSSLSTGPVTQRLSSRDSKLQLLDFLTSECAAVRMVACNKPNLLRAPKPVEEGTQAQARESDEAQHLKWMLIALGFPKPPENITSFQLFSKIEQKIKELVSKKPEQISKSLLKSRLSDKQWHHILEINAALKQEYETRRETLLKRLDVTIQSFMWSDRAKSKENKIAEVYQPIRRSMSLKSEVKIPEVLAAREDLLYMQKTSSGDAREKAKCAINKVLIGRVPDRGGRAWEHEVPPPEMPAFKQRDSQPQGRPQSGRGGGGGGRGGGGGGRGGGGGGRGGKVQGGWGGDSKSQSHGGNWEKGGGGYNQQGQNFHQGYDKSQIYSQGGGYQQSDRGYSQGGYNQGGYNQGGHNQDGYNQGGYNQGGYQGGGGYNQGYSQDQNKGYNNYSRGGHDGGGGRGGGRGRGRGRGRGNY